MGTFSRRSLIAFAPFALRFGTARAADVPEVLAAPADSSLVLARAIMSGALGADIPMRVWRSPDDLRAAVVSGRSRVFSLPVNVAANLRAKGLALRLVAAVSVGPMSILTVDPAIKGPGDLRGKRVQLYFRGDMPDISFRLVAERAGLNSDTDLAVDYAGSAPEAAQLFLAGRATTILLNEPNATATLTAATRSGLPAKRAFILQDAWAAAGGGFMPLAGVAVTEEAERETPGLSRRLKAALAEAAEWVRAEPEAAGRLAERVLGFKADAIVAALKVANVRVVGARTVRPDLESFLSAVAARSPALIGGRLPDDGFYADVE